jgi:hypothetical protein
MLLTKWPSIMSKWRWVEENEDSSEGIWEKFHDRIDGHIMASSGICYFYFLRKENGIGLP